MIFAASARASLSSVAGLCGNSAFSCPEDGRRVLPGEGPLFSPEGYANVKIRSLSQAKWAPKMKEGSDRDQKCLPVVGVAGNLAFSELLGLECS